jgi:putative toxin-antitoxin system antitoxin component (TIGR02293 family)
MLHSTNTPCSGAKRSPRLHATAGVASASTTLAAQRDGPSASFWELKKREVDRNPKAALRSLLMRARARSSMGLYDAVEQGVPTHLVLLLASALGNTVTSVMNLIGVSETTFRRKEEASEPLPEVAGHRVMALLRIIATLQRLLEESGDRQAVASFDLEGWVSEWIHIPLPQLDGKTPAEMLRNPEGQRAVEDLIERMRGGLPA